MNRLTLQQLIADLRLTLSMAALYSVLSFVGVGLIALLVLTGKPLNGGPPATFSAVLGSLGVFILVYVVAALGSGLAVFLLRPFRSSTVGWAATGALVSSVCYGALFGFTYLFRSTLAWFFALRGVTFGDGAGFGSFVLIILALFFVPAGAALGIYWRDNPPEQVQ